MHGAYRQQGRRQLRQEQALAIRMMEVFVDFERLRIVARQFGIVLMFVMAEVRTCGGILMLAISSRRSPGELERQS